MEVASTKKILGATIAILFLDTLFINVLFVKLAAHLLDQLRMEGVTGSQMYLRQLSLQSRWPVGNKRHAR